MTDEPRHLRLLLVEDNEEDALLLLTALERGGFALESLRVETEAAMREALQAQEWDVVFSDYSMPQFDAPNALRVLAESGRDLPFIVISGTVGEDVAVETLKLGAADYLLKGNLTRLIPSLERALAERQHRRELGATAAQAREALEELRRIKLAVECAADLIGIYDAAGRAIYHNLALTRTLGFTVEQFNTLERPESIFANQGIAEQVIAEVRESGSWLGDAFLHSRLGPVVETSMRINAVRDPQGRIISYLAVGSDKSAARRAERTIAEQAALLDQAQDVILVKDLRGTVRYWNKSAERLLGWSAEEAIGRKVQDFLVPDLDAYASAFAALVQCGEWHGEIANLTKDGREVLTESRWTLLRDSFNDPKSILAINTDITEKKQLEAQFFRAQRLESIGTLAGGIAHDLNNVLGPIIMAVDLFKLTLSDPDDLDLLDTIEVSARRGADLVKQVLSFARGIEGRRARVEPKPLLEEVAKIARDTFPKSINVHVRAAEDVSALAGDSTQLHQILLNLCVNARDAMSRGGRLTLGAENLEVDEHFAAMHSDARAGSYVLLTIGDTGEGMPPEVLEKIFEPFFTTKEIGKGTGLGLSTSLAIVKSHGGFITVESVVGQGTTFKVHLPTGVIFADGDEGATIGLPRGSGETVLVIDDEASVRTITRQALEAFGYRVLVAADGAEGVALYAQHAAKIAVVLTDMMMPVMDGVATIRALTRLNPAVRIIAVSGITSKAAEAEAAGEGVKHFLPKPYTAATLLAALRDVIPALPP